MTLIAVYRTLDLGLAGLAELGRLDEATEGVAILSHVDVVVGRVRLDLEEVVVTDAVGVGAAGRANHSHVEIPVVVALFAELGVLDKANLDRALVLIALTGDAIEVEGELGVGGVGEDWSDIAVIVVIVVIAVLVVTVTVVVVIVVVIVIVVAVVVVVVAVVVIVVVVVVVVVVIGDLSHLLLLPQALFEDDDMLL